MEGIRFATGVELVNVDLSSGKIASQNDVTSFKLKVRLATEKDCLDTQAISFLKQQKIGTWNVRSLAQGKLEVVKLGMEWVGLSILGISELRWIGMGHFLSNTVKVFYSGHAFLKGNGVAFICDKDTADSVLGYNPVSERIISLRLKYKAINTMLIQIYASTSDTDEEIEDFYGKLQTTVNSIPSGDMLIMMGGWNAKISKKEDPGISDKWGLGERNG